MTFVNDPIKTLVQVVQQLYGKVDVIIQFRPDFKHYNIFGKHFGGPCGYTTFPDDGGTPLIDINSNMPLDAIVETLAHELAHVIAGVEAGHGAEWERIFEEIHDEYNNIMRR